MQEKELRVVQLDFIACINIIITYHSCNVKYKLRALLVLMLMLLQQLLDLSALAQRDTNFLQVLLKALWAAAGHEQQVVQRLNLGVAESGRQ